MQEIHLGKRAKLSPNPEPAPAAALPRKRLAQREARPQTPRKTWLRFLVIPVFLFLLLAAAAAIYWVSQGSLPKAGKNPAAPRSASPLEAKSTETVPLPPPMPVEIPDSSDLAPSPPDNFSPQSAKPAAALAYEIVEKFCQAKTLDQRLSLIESNEAPEVLAKTPLAGPLPFVSFIGFLFQEPNNAENLTDFYFKVVFKNLSGEENIHTLLVRKRGTADPKVVTAPFLDLYGGRLAAFAAKPSTEAVGATFHAVVYVIGSCNNETIPDRQNKFTLLLLPFEGGKEIARAYFGKNSKIGEMLTDGSHSFKFGEYRPCTVFLTWNPNNGNPYLEALQIKSQNWNP